MAALHLPLGCFPHLSLLSQEEQQRLHHDVHHEQIQNGERGLRYSMFYVGHTKARIQGYTDASGGIGHSAMSTSKKSWSITKSNLMFG